ncbi:hypothetical protein [Persicitalea jodogahamensis]|uniref:Uncharacterized protein n=1 Tax=Persicitalea jodogahamensis TaxID=402147 RepID=A0A8J3D424_9BACT|nr:hypothetical protein [Persicitalea jodogahamensis]GHB79805.1 hypothetical protein GCM10007390_37440 [Persicitalea jodogahamensis]
MKLIVSFLMGLAGLLTYLGNRPGPAFEIETKNGGSFEVEEVRWGDKLAKYSANIMAPVCEEGICYNVNVVFNWNLIGEFIDYQVQPYDPLTKLDHKPFTLADYAKLQGILTNHDLIFTGLPADELVVKAEETVDGYSGATIEAIKDEVIDGALFTCYTLWHIANGAVVDSIRQHTQRQLDKPMIAKIIGYNTASANYYLIDHMSETQFAQNLPEIIGLIQAGKGYFPKNAIEKIPEKLFGRQEMQDFLIQNYDSLSYYTQVAALSKLQNVPLQKDLTSMLLTQISDRNSIQNQKIIALIIRNNDEEAIKKMVDHLIEKKIKLSAANYQLLQKHKVAGVEALEKI